MKLDEAIEITELTTSIRPLVHPPDEHDAIKLLIEAGKEVKHVRLISVGLVKPLLPGETEE